MTPWQDTRYVMDISAGFLLVPGPGPCSVHLAECWPIKIKCLLHARGVNSLL